MSLQPPYEPPANLPMNALSQNAMLLTQRSATCTMKRMSIPPSMNSLVASAGPDLLTSCNSASPYSVPCSFCVCPERTSLERLALIGFLPPLLLHSIPSAAEHIVFPQSGQGGKIDEPYSHPPPQDLSSKAPSFGVFAGPWYVEVWLRRIASKGHLMKSRRRSRIGAARLEREVRVKVP